MVAASIRGLKLTRPLAGGAFFLVECQGLTREGSIHESDYAWRGTFGCRNHNGARVVPPWHAIRLLYDRQRSPVLRLPLTILGACENSPLFSVICNAVDEYKTGL